MARHMPHMMRFRDVVVQMHNGRTNPGAAWPDFETQYHARHLQGGRPVCAPPPEVSGTIEPVSKPCAFLGAHDGHFGHFVAETAPRLPQTLAELPEDTPLVFSARMDLSPDTAHPAFLEVLRWLGAAPERLRFVNRPTRFRDLSIAAQGEHLGSAAPPLEYLRHLEDIARRNGLHPAPETVLYVSRARLSPELAGHAGEAYLDACLEALGVAVLHPETTPLPEQLRAYAKARTLIFAEGSAAHGRQLLGRIDQHIAILVRRPGQLMAMDALTARSSRLDHVAATRAELRFKNQSGRRWPHSTMSLYDVPRLLNWFDSIGVPLRRVWDPDHYAEARDARILAWIRAIHRPKNVKRFQMASSPAHFRSHLSKQGLEHLCEPAAKAIARAQLLAGGGH